MNRLCMVLASAVWLVTGGADRAAAQGPFVGGAVSVGAWKPQPVSGGTPSTTASNTSPDTVMSVLAFEAGWWLTPSTALAMELDMPIGRRAVTHRTFYFSPTLHDVAYRERNLFVVVRHDILRRGVFRLQIVGGGGAVYAHALERVAQGQFGSDEFGPFGPETTKARTMLGVVAGADVAFSLAPNVDVVPQLRVQWTRRGGITDFESFRNLGLMNPAYRVGVGARVRF